MKSATKTFTGWVPGSETNFVTAKYIRNCSCPYERAREARIDSDNGKVRKVKVTITVEDV